MCGFLLKIHQKSLGSQPGGEFTEGKGKGWKTRMTGEKGRKLEKEGKVLPLSSFFEVGASFGGI